MKTNEPKHQRAHQSKRGFSFIELMVVLGIAAILSIAAFMGLFGRKSTTELNTTGQQVLTLLREAQSRSVSGDSGATWGVYFGNAAPVPFYALYKNTYSSQNTVGYYRLPSDVIFVTSTVASGGATQITFSPNSGIPSASTSISLRLVPQGTVYTINISASGRVSF